MRGTVVGDPGHDPAIGAWWWLAFVLLLGPVAVGRLDAVVTPVVVVALAVALRHPVVASALLTAGAWVKVAPGALLLPLVLVLRRPWRHLVLPAAVVCVVVAGAVAAGGGLGHLTSFLTEQSDRGLQVESVAATPWVLAGLGSGSVRVVLNDAITTWEITGPGTATAAAALGLALPVALAAGRDDAEVDRRAAAIGRDPKELREVGIAGTPTAVVDRLGALAELGVERVYLQVLDLADLDHLELVASQVMPQLR